MNFSLVDVSGRTVTEADATRLILDHDHEHGWSLEQCILML